MLRKISLLILFLISFTTLAGEFPYVLVRHIQGSERLPPELAKLMEKTALQVVMKQPDLEILLSGSDTPTSAVVEIIAVESEVQKNPNGYRIEARLIDLRTKKLINKIDHDAIREEDLLRLFQSGIETLFVPWQAARKPKLPEPREKVAPPSAPKAQPKTTTFRKKNPPPESIDFRKIVQGLKSDVDEKIVEVVETKEDDKKKDEKKENTPPVTLPKVVSEEEIPEEKPSFIEKYDWWHRLSLGFDDRSINSEGLVSTTTRASFLTVSGVGYVPMVTFRGKLAVGYELGVSRALSAPEETPPLYKAGAFLTYPAQTWIASLGVIRDVSFFMNLPEPGGDIHPYALNMTWVKLKGEKSLNIKGLKGTYILGMALSLPLQGQTSYKPLASASSYGGTDLQVSITPPYRFQKWEANVALDRTNITSQGEIPFTFNESRIALNVRRSL